MFDHTKDDIVSSFSEGFKDSFRLSTSLISSVASTIAAFGTPTRILHRHMEDYKEKRSDVRVTLNGVTLKGRDLDDQPFSITIKGKEHPQSSEE